MNLSVWRHFLTYPKVFCRPFVDGEVNAMEIDMYSDASRNFDKGFGAFFKEQLDVWPMGQTFYAGM